MAGPMTPDRWERVSELVEQACELPPHEREVFLRQECGEDSNVFQWAHKLARQQPGSEFLDKPVRGAPASLVGSRTPLPVGFLLADRFEIRSEPNPGGVGDVYQAFDRELEEVCAVKLIRHHVGREAAMVARLRHDVRLSRGMAHPNVCRVYDLMHGRLPSGEPALFCVMEWLEGRTLSGRLMRGTLSFEEALPLAEDIAAGLAAARRAGFVYGSLKPGNIILTAGPERPRAVITDLGVAIRPEQAVSPEADSYSFGMLLAEMVGIDAEDPIQPADPATRVWFSVIRKCVCAQPNLRYASVEEAARGLRPKPARFSLKGRGAIAAMAAMAAAWLSRSKASR